jgi:CMP/dCMP kinase
LERGDFMKITVCGDSGSGISSVSKSLAEKLGFRYISMGEIFRDYANKKGKTVLELNKAAQTDKTIDEGIDLTLRRSGLLGDDIVIDSRIAWHFIKDSFKLYISVDQTIGAMRILNSDRGSVEKYNSLEEAIEDVKERSEIEITRYKDKYNILINKMDNYDFVIDSTNISVLEVTNRITTEMQNRNLISLSIL